MPPKWPEREKCRQFATDHVVETFVVTVRSLGGVGKDTLKDQIQKKFEVVSIEATNRR